jgi:hypothetical protein
MLTTAKAQAKKTLDEVTARATAIHDGAERRLNLLSTRHAETIRRLTEILDGVSGLVASETARLSLEEEVEQTVAKTIAEQLPADGAAPAARGESTGGGEPAARTAAAATVTDPSGRGNQRGTTPPAVQGAAQAAQPQAHAGAGSPAGAGRSTAAGTGSQAPARPANQGSGTVPFPAARDTHQGASAPANPQAGTPGGQARAAGRGPAGQSLPGSGDSRTAPEDHTANRLPNGSAGDRHTSAAPGNLSQAIDSDETTEGVRIVREQRQR